MEYYRDRVVRFLVICSIVWAVLGMAVGVYVAAELLWPTIDFGQQWLSFGRLRTLHTNGISFGFSVSALMGTAFYSVQRTSHVTLFAPRLAWFTAVAWQITVLAGGISLLAGWNSSKEYAELEWPFDILITIAWVSFAIVFFGTITRRKIKQIYVSNWFYGGLIIVITMIHVVNSLAMPATLFKSYPIYSGAQDAIVQWWYGHNAVGFLLTGGFLGMLYYFLPKQADRPIWSYKLSVVAFWAFTYSYIWAGPHHLHYNAIPDWVQNLAMVMSLILLAPSWATMINGIMTVSGASKKLKTDPAMKFIVLSLAFYGLATFEGPMMAIKTVNALSHYTDWTIGHVHSGALGWVAMVSIGAMYHLLPILFGKTRMYSISLINTHFWMATIGTVLYITSMWVNGILQGLMWRAYDSLGFLEYSFVETVEAMHPFYALRAFGGALFVTGAFIMAYNIWRTIRGEIAAGEPIAAAAATPAPA